MPTKICDVFQIWAHQVVKNQDTRYEGGMACRKVMIIAVTLYWPYIDLYRWAYKRWTVLGGDEEGGWLQRTLRFILRRGNCDYPFGCTFIILAIRTWIDSVPEAKQARRHKTNLNFVVGLIFLPFKLPLYVKICYTEMRKINTYISLPAWKEKRLWMKPDYSFMPPAFWHQSL